MPDILSYEGDYSGHVPLRVLHVSTYDTNGGAARAAYSLHSALRDAGVASRMVVGDSGGGDDSVVAVNSLRFRAASEADRRVTRLQRSPLRTWRSSARFASLSSRWINSSGADVVNLHWVTNGLLSVEEIGAIDKPIVWSMYDMWPFAGTEHYCGSGDRARWRSGYLRDNRPEDEHGLDVDRWTFERKQRCWTRPGLPMLMVPASGWLSDAVRASALMRNWPVTRIPHLVSDVAFTPLEPQAARRALDLPQGRPIVGFLASAGIADDRKGFDLLAAAMPKVLASHPDALIAVAGPGAIGHPSASELPIHWLGHLHGDDALRLAYCSTDVMAVPSREDNLPLSAMEAQMCGRPVVAFGIGGLPDIIDHRVTGYLAEPFDPDDLATGLLEALDSRAGATSWGPAARDRAQRTFGPAPVVHQYLEAYEQAIALTRTSARSASG